MLLEPQGIGPRFIFSYIFLEICYISPVSKQRNIESCEKHGSSLIQLENQDELNKVYILH